MVEGVRHSDARRLDDMIISLNAGWITRRDIQHDLASKAGNDIPRDDFQAAVASNGWAIRRRGRRQRLREVSRGGRFCSVV
jgi:hypothetical protein